MKAQMGSRCSPIPLLFF